MPHPPMVLVEWDDALHGQGEYELRDLGNLVRLAEVGFLVKDEKDAVTLAMEHQENCDSVRLWLTIPRVNIVSITKLRAVPKGRRKRASS